jgi:hypothetical protein
MKKRNKCEINFGYKVIFKIGLGQTSEFGFGLGLGFGGDD